MAHSRNSFILHWQSVLYVIGLILAFSSLSLFLPLGTSIWYQEWKAFYALLSSMGVGLTSGGLLYLLFRKNFNPHCLKQREACFIVTFAWLGIAGLGALPYLLGGVFPQAGGNWFSAITEAYFEAMSGFTTTGASVMTEIEIFPRSLLLWRAETQWLGGMGIILLSVAILPLLGVGGLQLFKAEVPGVSVDKVTPRISETAKHLWLVYAGLTALEITALMFAGMDFYNAVCHSFTTLSTGGFSPQNISVEHFHSAWVDWIITVFMMLGGMNFVLLYKITRKQFKPVLKDPEFRVYSAISALAVLLLVFNLLLSGTYSSASEAFRHGAFQMASIMTTTGFSSANWENWPVFSQALLLTLMLLGGMAGSTAGGCKTVRLIILIKYTLRELAMIIHPRAVISLKLSGHPISRDVIRSVLAFFAIFNLMILFSTLTLAAMGVDLITSISAVISSLGNVGPGLARVGAAHNYHHLPDLAKWLLVFCMLLGRLEIYTAIVLFIPDFWKK
ncbi:potassium transporter [bacterium (Candidatus Blackallbacteria) CG17_big_fil_post_rev_8_21_14_2_50_48_46]|uniref:Potassium transporter n=1 Tax=bacterium (Candidatus Blackallbacteria) CG17_big_fil_post_rev_8_21_14_2_50_48_46 TaxID=2014261 RepID=A0A2M7G383_9BACT|nr:MAG: potassium transporter [bacterium (Candidatus Blackallbacteria) CG18_big_fil_WC_8_21_14_2_50_49_26]PIW16299.1 MAG: potassium transporter [bacterium (Candidatus Blackallbacteria) CG17_big_fil_post_rev_8_21_14_2_50_48_46]PIW45313.1 MAG: potassium transporter [bacterium (Candidatus Blackallbacteria) CG13_big_fil_rev_8_21_14_2_50_49_14]